jgi:hypothetical protein
MYWPIVLNKNLSGVAKVFHFLLPEGKRYTSEITSGVFIQKNAEFKAAF